MGLRARRSRGILPLDEYLQIAGLPFQMIPQMMVETAFFGVHESSFASAERMIGRFGSGLYHGRLNTPKKKLHPCQGLAFTFS
jgi:hypothetical protein